MPGTGLGIGLKNVAPFSLLNCRKEHFSAPLAGDVDYIVDEVDATGLSAGDALTLLATADGILLPNADYITLTGVDADQNLQASVKIEGYRLGVLQSETLTIDTDDGDPTTATSTLMYDQIISATVVSVAEAASSADTIALGVAGTGLGFRLGRIKAVTDVKLILHNDAGTVTPIAVSTSSVDATSFGLKGITAAGADTYEVYYIPDRDNDGLPRHGTSNALA